jgi:regulator of protease activity HflC (stomatin/prohibitin superfamily)
MTKILLGIGFVLIVSYNCFKMISPGYVGVVVDLFGSSQGVEAKELGVGMHWISPWKSVYTFPVFEQNDTWEDEEGFTFQTSEGMAIKANIGITFHLLPATIPIIFQKYRRGMHDISHVFLRNFIRDAINKSASKMTVQDLYSSGKELFFQEVEKHVRADLVDMGIIITRIYLIGQFNFPSNVIQAINSSIEANQKAQQRENELRQAEAEAKKEVATAEGRAKCIILEAEAKSKANNVLNSSLSSNLLEWMKIQKWDGKLPTVQGTATPMIKM